MRRAGRAVALVALAVGASATAQDDPRLRADALRAELRAGPPARTLPITLVRLAEAALDTLALDAADSAALVALPTPEQIERVLDLAAEAAFAVGRADLALVDALASVEQDPEFASRRDLQDLRSALAVEYAAFRLPMAVARSGALLAPLSDPRARPVSIAQNAIDAVSHLDLREPRLEARRDIVYGVGALVGARAPTIDDPQPARAHFERALAREPDLALLDARAFVEASLGLARALALEGRIEQARRRLDALAGAPPFRRQSAEPEPAYMLLLEDVRFLVERVPRAGEAPRLALARACADLAESMHNEDAGAPGEARRALTLEKLGAMPTPELGPGDPLPPLLAAARARALARDPARRDEAIALLEASLAGAPIEGRLSMGRAEALWRLAALLLDRLRESERLEDGARALDCLVAIARDRPDFPDAPAAIDAAGRLARSLLGAPGAPAREQALGALRLAIERYADHPSADRWRLTLAERAPTAQERRALLEGVRAGAPEGAYAQARLVDLDHAALAQADDDQRPALARALLDRFDIARAAIDAADLDADEARAMRARVGAQALDALLVVGDEENALSLARSLAGAPGSARWSGALTAHLRRRLDAALANADDLAVARLAPLLESACRLRIDLDIDPEERERTQITLAGALLAQDRCAEALALVEELLEGVGRREDLLLAQADALACLGRDGEAFALYREVAQPLETRGARTDAFWRSWAGMLEILSRENEGGARTETIRREIRRLRALDEQLGAGATRRRIEALE